MSGCIPKSPTRDYLAGGTEFSYGGALSIVDDLAARYADAGYGVGHRVAIVLENRPEHSWHLLALNAVGACVVPLNPDYLDHEFAYAIEFADSALVIGIGKHLETLRRVVSTLDPAVALINAEDLPAKFPSPAQSVNADVVKDLREASSSTPRERPGVPRAGSSQTIPALLQGRTTHPPAVGCLSKRSGNGSTCHCQRFI